MGFLEGQWLQVAVRVLKLWTRLPKPPKTAGRNATVLRKVLQKSLDSTTTVLMRSLQNVELLVPTRVN
ncbi:hypothetical protein Gohar_001881 [Gossypium harknessii]|uniref:Uncharacterized protein n=1 Tax=Gossypium harknessii TaxID=34285 RepID=A0A7J9I652_9ROSI|nr:hypothetical protein [Gossypium harknessii]